MGYLNMLLFPYDIVSRYLQDICMVNQKMKRITTSVRPDTADDVVYEPMEAESDKDGLMAVLCKPHGRHVIVPHDISPATLRMFDALTMLLRLHMCSPEMCEIHCTGSSGTAILQVMAVSNG
jgi:hypothetical protein